MIHGFLEHGSYLGIVLVLILTGCGLPVPEEVAIIAAGVLSATRDLEWPLALASCLVGAVAGDCVMYYIGYHFGRSVLKEHPRWTGFLTPEREKQIERMIRLHGMKVFFGARFLVGLRGPVYITAGILRVSFRRFILVDIICASAVISIFFGLSYFFGDQILAWIRRGEIAFTVAVIAVVVLAILLFWRHRRKVRLRKAVQAAAQSRAREGKEDEGAKDPSKSLV
jgi:membrane protein DedA with SNARE-associated domain